MASEGTIDKAPSVCLFGAALDTGNLGVSALGHSILASISKLAPDSTVTVFDHSSGSGDFAISRNGDSLRVERCGAFHTKRVYRRESLWNIRLSAWLGGLGNVAARAIQTAGVVMDITGGDSFTEIYGPHRFRVATLTKLIALEQGRPLILLPQTYGPFRTSRGKRLAEKIVARSAMAWARDARSFEVLKELLGAAYDSSRHRLGVDVAFSLPGERPPDHRIDDMARELFDRPEPIVGLNVSGLLMNNAHTATKQFGFQADYRKVIIAFVERLLRNTEARVLLVPHVVAPPGHYESDNDACFSVVSDVENRFRGGIFLCPNFDDPREVKWVISQCDWFCGTRMHSTIAALSSGVPTAAIAYSPKTLGVFETCGQGERVADPRQLDTEEMVDSLWQSWESRDEARQSLAEALPAVKQQAEDQMDAIVAVIQDPATRNSGKNAG